MKMLKIIMPDSSEWVVPVDTIAFNRASHYVSEFGGDVSRSLDEDTLPLFEDDYEIEEWAENNMNWDDVAAFAKKVKEAATDFQEGWVNGVKEIVEIDSNDCSDTAGEPK